MDRRVKVLVGGVGIVVLLAILVTTTMGSSAEFVEPTDLAETDDHDGDFVKLEGRVVDLVNDGEITFDVIDENHTKPVTYDGEMPETMSEGRIVVAEGVYDGEELTADELTVRAHEGEHPDDAGANESEHDGDMPTFEEYEDHPDYDEYEDQLEYDDETEDNAPDDAAD